MKNLRPRLLAALLAAALCLGLLGCQAKEEDTANGPAPEVQEPQEPQGTPTTEMENLVKLCKVWGYTKYMHPAFLLGHKDWDEELLALIPQVRELRTAEEVNELLHNWFVGLGEIDYGTRTPARLWFNASEEEKAVVVDTSWTTDAAYLGEALAADFAQFPKALPNVERKNAPVQFETSGALVPVFSNEPEHTAGYGDPNFRLLGLFRLWNAMEYYFPYLHLMDGDWEDCLTEHIPAMLEGTDQESYEMTLASLAFRLQDAHIDFLDSTTGQSAMLKYIGTHPFPATLTEAEGKLVVTGTMEGCPLEAGDVLVSVNGKEIDTLAEEVKRYVCYSREDMLLMYARYVITVSETEEIAVTVLRGGEELDFTVGCLTDPLVTEHQAYEILEGGIGLINPSQVKEEGTTDQMMAALRDTAGLVIDMRQYPGSNDFARLYYGYIPPENLHAITFAAPSTAVPGAYVKKAYNYGYSNLMLSGSPDFYPYDKPVVVLMNEDSMSFSETAITGFRMGENVVVMGSNSVGANGNVVFLPLPGGLEVSFSSLGVYQADGTQSQRTGITPDIWVEPTIQGVAEGRDELLEAAIAYIQTQTKACK